MAARATILEEMGGEEGCRRLSEEFYGHVGHDSALRALFPGKRLTCAIEEFAAFLVQFLGGEESHTARRWWLSLHESHARFDIGPVDRDAWLKNMRATLAATPVSDDTQQALLQLFEQSSAYIVHGSAVQPHHAELAARWEEQRMLDAAVDAIANGRDAEALALAPQFASRPSVFAGLLARMMRAGRPALTAYVIDAPAHDSALATCRFAGKPLLHHTAGAGCLDAVASLLKVGSAVDCLDDSGHTALYCAANECATAAGPGIVRALVQAGANVNAAGGATRATALHMAARRGHVAVARALLEHGAALDARDRKGDTSLQRAIHCRQPEMAAFLTGRTAAAHRG
jgi:hemoglobin